MVLVNRRDGNFVYEFRVQTIYIVLIFLFFKKLSDWFDALSEQYSSNQLHRILWSPKFFWWPKFLWSPSQVFVPRLAQAAAAKPATDNKELAAEPTADQSESESDEEDDKEDAAEKPAAQQQQQQQPSYAKPGEQPKPGQLFYMPNAQGQMTLMKALAPGANGAPPAVPGATATKETAKETGKVESKWCVGTLHQMIRSLKASMESF